ncbi:MAG: hypothetical protein E7615_05310 [Ruminococcaceae bacterium]|nr:hypothetical protein [Oscillospiraceae bacterium]
MKKNGRFHFRYILLTSILIISCALFFARVIYLQVNAPEKETSVEYTTRTLTVKAIRGEIFDRNGNALVSNEYTYNVYLDGGSFPRGNHEANKAVSLLTDILGNKIKTDNFPIEYIDSELSLKALDRDSSVYKSFIKMLDRFSLPRTADCEELYAYLTKRYGLTDNDGNPAFDEEKTLAIMALRYEAESRDFSASNPFTVAYGISDDDITALEEANIKGVSIEKSAKRIYNYPGYASHILGRTGPIQSEDLDYYTEKGYSMNAIVGIDGVEKAFEEYLRGVDGTLVIVEDLDGNRIDEYYKTEPIPGKDVYLTIDIGLQITAEDSLAYNVGYIRDKANQTIEKETKENTDENGNLLPDAEIPKYIGEDVTSGAATLVNPNNGEIYAIASYPTYDLSTYLEDYSKLLNAEHTPLFNRALLGTYEPGSTFKVGVAGAALENGVITPSTTIFDSGVYKYYPDFQPECWIYTAHGYGHGNVNVISAIQHSCNYFFYDVGRQLTIEKMNAYMKDLGLGELTGIELPEKKGILAGPEYSSSVNKVWVPGDTVQASIGQSDNNFTPLQISMYLSTIINGGNRYQAHLLYAVKEYGTDTVIYQPVPTVLNTVSLSEETLDVLKMGMKSVMEQGTAAPVFADYPMEIGGKTGTAQVGTTRSHNGIFMAFAPYDNPQIVASCIIEQAGGSNDCGITIRRMFNDYFNITE